MESKALENNETEGKSLDQSIQNDRTPLSREEIVMEKEQVTANGNENGRNDNTETLLRYIDTEALAVGYHPRKNIGDIEKLQGSIRRDGLQEPLLVYEDGEGKYVVIDGCRRLKAIREFGWKTIPCLIKKGLTADQAAHLSYVKNTERNALNPIEIGLHIRAMRERFGFSMRDLEIKGYGSAAAISNKIKLLDLPDIIQRQIQDGKLTAAHGLALLKLNSSKEQTRMAKRIVDHDLTAKKSEMQIKSYLRKSKKEPKAKTRVPDSDIPGVYIKDSRDMCELPDKSVHLIVSSPPYNVGMEYEKGVTFDEHLEMVQGVLKECARVLVSGGIMALEFVDIHYFKTNKEGDLNEIKLMGHHYQNYLKRNQIFLTDQIIWKKLTPWLRRQHLSYTSKTAHTDYKISDNFSHIYVFRKKGERELPSEDIVLSSRLTKEEWLSCIDGVWFINQVHNMQGHPSIYPDELCARLIKMYSYENDTVLDPWLGSGTTVKVARELNREGVGYEKEAQYKEVIMKKLETVGEKSGEEVVGPMTQILTDMKEEIEKMEEAPIQMSVAAENEAVTADDYLMDEMEQR